MIYLLVVLASLGFAVFLWCLLGILLIPVFGSEMITLCFVRENAPFLEHRVRSYGWLREGKLNGGRLILVDDGLSEEGRKIVKILCKKYTWVSCCKGTFRLNDNHYVSNEKGFEFADDFM